MNGDRAEIERRAYAIWEREGRPQGRDFEHWLAAEAELRAAGAAPTAASRKPRATRAVTSSGASAPKRTTSRTTRRGPTP
jgi:Protein of unknown function (DUF2934)